MSSDNDNKETDRNEKTLFSVMKRESFFKQSDDKFYTNLIPSQVRIAEADNTA